MIYVLITTTVEDMEERRSAFAAATPLQRQLGSIEVRCFRQSGKPNEVIILGGYEFLEKAQALFNSRQFREAAKPAGVATSPQVTDVEPLLEPAS